MTRVHNFPANEQQDRILLNHSKHSGNYMYHTF